MLFRKNNRNRDSQDENQAGITVGGIAPGQAFDLSDSAVDILTRGFGSKGNLVNWGTTSFGLLDVGLSAGTAPRGKKVISGISAGAAQLGGLAAFTPGYELGTAIGTAVMPGLGTVVGAIAGGTASFLTDRIIRRGVFKGITGMIADRPVVRFGGFQDSQQAWTMRGVADRELRSSRLAARRYLGREANLLHQ